MADGNMVMDTAEGRNKATEMRNIAIQIEDLLNDVSRKIDEINNVDTGIYQGGKRPAELKAELDEFRRMFANVYGQILKSSDDIALIANTMEQE
jgi:hypothetical protein